MTIGEHAASTHSPGYRHLLRLSDSRGIFEHALFSRPRLEHGYCTDDNARLAIVAARGDREMTGARVLTRLGTRFTLDAQTDSGSVRNRMHCRGTWEDEPALNDAWGRSVWALGTVAVRGHEAWLRREAMDGFERGIQNQSGHLMADSFAALGAAEVVRADPDHVPARSFLVSAGNRIASLVGDSTWRWPEPRLRYSNGSLAEVMISAGVASGDRALLDLGLEVLDWLWDVETIQGRLSVTPVGGRAFGEPQPAFDQQPIEVTALADACYRAFVVSGSQVWRRRVETCGAWFLGHNDSGVPMIDFRTGGGYDGLQPTGPNLNQGAESTLAMVATLQRVEALERSVGATGAE